MALQDKQRKSMCAQVVAVKRCLWDVSIVLGMHFMVVQHGKV
jgi:hypothetical protein